MLKMKTLTVNGQTYTVEDADSATFLRVVLKPGMKQASHTADEIYQHVHSGGVAVLYDSNEYWPLTSATPSEVCFGNTKVINAAMDTVELVVDGSANVTIHNAGSGSSAGGAEVTIDKTLSVSGAAADAKATGDAIHSVIKKTCPAISQSGRIIACEPVEGYPLSVAASAGATEIVRLGKNLFDFTQTPPQVTYPTSSGTTATRYGFAITLPGGTYTLHAEEIAPSNAQYYLYGVVAKADGTSQGSCNLRVNTANYTCTVTVEDSGTIYIYDGTTGTQSSAKALFSKFNVQVELGDHKTPFAPFQAPETFAPGDVIPGKAGVNTIYADTGDITVTGRADPGAMIEKLTNAIVALGGNI